MKKFTLFFLSLVFCAATIHAAEFEGVGGLPAHPDPSDARTKDWFIYTLNPGDVKKDELMVINNSDRENKVILYPADSTPSTDGGFALKQMVEPQTEVGKWVTLSQTELTIPAYGSVLVPFRIEIPKNATPDVGEHTGGILIQKADQQLQARGGMTLSTRVGVRIYVTIPGEIIKKLEIQRFTLEENADKKLSTAVVTVKNSGNVSQNVSVKINVHSDWEWLKEIPLLNRFVKDFPLENTRELQVLRGDSLTSNFEFPKPLFGNLEVAAAISYDNGSKVLTTPSLHLHIPLDHDVLIVILLFIAFVILLCLLLIAKRRNKKHNEKVLSSRKNRIGQNKPLKRISPAVSSRKHR